ncbi:MAG: M15 family metallopeptidase [Cyclobacteriaceae bacterium]|jgi:LAS superfamily LD-carboxypeptidase LdcB|nr:M15 family metallopeptidase [Cyclobacteriaceae bacterium]
MKQLNFFGLLFLILTCRILSAQEIDKNYLLGRFDPAKDDRFIKPDDAYTEGSARSQYLRKETYETFVRMADAAKKDGVKLVIISATRNFDQQKAIWDRKWQADMVSTDDVHRAKKIMLYSSMPGTSRHHWGTDIDLNNLNNDYFEKGKGLKIYNWLKNHAAEYGFCQPYTNKDNGRTGYEEEKWHWSYTPLSNDLLKQYKEQVAYEDITGFNGSNIAPLIDVIRSYVDGVNCR